MKMTSQKFSILKPLALSKILVALLILIDFIVIPFFYKNQ